MNKIVKFRLSGDYGHFKIPYTNNNPLTYSFIPKTALMGLIGAVVGIERNDMKRLFPILCNSLKYSLSFNNEFRKESISTYCVNFNNFTKSDRPNKAPKPVEHLKKPDWNVYITVNDNSTEEVKSIFNCFIENIINGVYVWTLTLGAKQCSCIINEIEVGEATIENSDFTTKNFVKIYDNSDLDEIVYSDNIPTFQDENWCNDTTKNVDVFFVDNNKTINSSGEYYLFNNEKFVMI
jgi:CRISPR-associated protein Cas5h